MLLLICKCDFSVDEFLIPDECFCSFHFQGLCCLNILFLATTEPVHNPLMCSWGSYWCRFRVLYNNIFVANFITISFIQPTVWLVNLKAPHEIQW